ncbi:MAG: hypothetical protein JWR37_3358 [Mycobacterium sp.]|nr:hypothetical protein [Mycobacterium sp.]
MLLETYANRVAEAVESELGQVDPSAGRPLFLFATDPLLDLYRGIHHKRQVVVIPGAPDELRPDQIDSALRESLSALNAQRNNELVAEIGNDVSRGLVATDVTDTAPAPWSPGRCRLWCTTSPLTSSVTSTARPARRSVALMKPDLSVGKRGRPAVSSLQSGRWRCNRRCQAIAQFEPVWSRPRVISRRRLSAAARWCSH